MRNSLSLPLGFTLLVSATVLSVAPSRAANETCPECKPEAEMTFRERTKADRDKFQLEMKQNSKRPWDGLDLGFRRPATERGPAGEAAPAK